MFKLFIEKRGTLSHSFGLAFFMGIAAFGSVVFSPSCFAKKEDYFLSQSVVGSRALTQTFEIYQRMKKQNDDREGFFVEPIDEEGGSIESSHQERLPLGWTLGVGYNHLSSPASGLDPAIADDGYSGKLGLSWEGSPSFDMGLTISLDSIPAESYRHGTAFFVFEYFLSLKSADPVKEAKQNHKRDSDDAASFYQMERERLAAERTKAIQDRLDEIRGMIDNYPYLKFSYFLGFYQHSVFPKTFRKPSLGAATTLEANLTQYQQGLEISYAPNARTILNIGANAFTYSNSAQSFAALIEADAISRQPLIFGHEQSAATNQLFSFPQFSFYFSVNRSLSDKESIDVLLTDTVYSFGAAPIAFSIQPTYFRDLSKLWQLGIGANLILGGTSPLYSGTVGLNRRL